MLAKALPARLASPGVSLDISLPPIDEEMIPRTTVPRVAVVIILPRIRELEVGWKPAASVDEI